MTLSRRLRNRGDVPKPKGAGTYHLARLGSQYRNHHITGNILFEQFEEWVSSYAGSPNQVASTRIRYLPFLLYNCGMTGYTDHTIILSLSRCLERRDLTAAVQLLTRYGGTP